MKKKEYISRLPRFTAQRSFYSTKQQNYMVGTLSNSKRRQRIVPQKMISDQHGWILQSCTCYGNACHCGFDDYYKGSYNYPGTVDRAFARKFAGEDIFEG